MNLSASMRVPLWKNDYLNDTTASTLRKGHYPLQVAPFGEEHGFLCLVTGSIGARFTNMHLSTL